MPSVLEVCGGAGGQALGLEEAGFEHAAIVEIDPDACNTLRANRPGWKVVEGDIRSTDGRQFDGIDLLAGGPPCQPFAVGGMQLGERDERDLFPEALRLVREARPRAVMLENVPGLGQVRFRAYRQAVISELVALGYLVRWGIARANMWGVPQARPRMVLVAVSRSAGASEAPWPWSLPGPSSLAPSVGNVLYDLMVARGWPGAYRWAIEANEIAPTIVGGSKKHGGADLGPSRAKAAWRRLGVNGMGIADEAPDRYFPEDGLPKLTVRMVARLQGFPDSWEITGRKTSSYRQVGNAFPPPVARAFGEAILRALS